MEQISHMKHVITISVKLSENSNVVPVYRRGQQDNVVNVSVLNNTFVFDPTYVSISSGISLIKEYTLINTPPTESGGIYSSNTETITKGNYNSIEEIIIL